MSDGENTRSLGSLLPLPDFSPPLPPLTAYLPKKRGTNLHLLFLPKWSFATVLGCAPSVPTPRGERGILPGWVVSVTLHLFHSQEHNPALQVLRVTIKVKKVKKSYKATKTVLARKTRFAKAAHSGPRLNTKKNTPRRSAG